MKLDDYQWDAVKKLKNGSILCGEVGSGKSLTALTYYYVVECGGLIGIDDNYIPMANPKDLIIITTARKRDTKEWEKELISFLLGPCSSEYEKTYPGIKIIIDSWNNIGKYVEIKNSFFIFDEQRLVGYGAWAHSFLKIAKNNHWILLSATPGDTWSDYITVFIANGFYKNKTEFMRKHAVYSRYSKYLKIERYIAQGVLIRNRNEILVNMDYKKPTVQHHITINVGYDKDLYKSVATKRWNIYSDKPIKNISEYSFVLKRITNEDESRILALRDILDKHDKCIIFYNYNYELDMLKTMSYPIGMVLAEWNGKQHMAIPKSDKWAYLVQYTAGSEGWNCIETDTIIFFSQNPSYRTMHQSEGRIDRRNTPFSDLYYYHLISKSPVDIGISRALSKKKDFNNKAFFSSFNNS